MSRAVIAWDRVVTLLIGLLLITVGLAGILWWLGDFLGWSQQPLQVDRALELTEEAWWGWAVGAAGILLILLGLRWLTAHVPDRRVSNLNSPGPPVRAGSMPRSARSPAPPPRRSPSPRGSAPPAAPSNATADN